MGITHGVGLYVHIPFCTVRCHYCDFNTYAGLERYFEAYVEALRAEIRAAAARWGRLPARTVFIGGGTPSLLPSELLAGVLDTLRESFEIAPDAEITSEANPGTVDRERFAAMREMGINRLSMGVQSFDDAELRWLGRIHTAEEAVRAYEVARSAGFDNINLDFMFGLPEQNPDVWQATMDRAIALAPEHLSLYSLTVEPGTPLAAAVAAGHTPDTDDDLAADLYLAAIDRLGSAGYAHYEISNWAGDEARFACRHNLVYWRDEPYLGFGAGAHSYYGDRRWWNVRPVPAYIGRAGDEAGPVAGSEIIDRRLAMGETMMLGLRLLMEGVEEERFAARFGVTLDEVFDAELKALSTSGLIERVAGRVRLTPQGRLLGNRVFGAFLPDT